MLYYEMFNLQCNMDSACTEGRKSKNIEAIAGSIIWR